MVGNSFGIVFRIASFGESHGESLGVVIDGCPPGLPLSEAEIQHDLDRRRPGRNPILETARGEPDLVRILSGVFEKKTMGSPIAMMVGNEDVDSTAYERRRGKFRGSHADWTVLLKHGCYDWRGGGRLSNRETIGRVAAGAVAKKILGIQGVQITGFVRSVGDISAEEIDIDAIDNNYDEIGIRCPDAKAAQRMRELVLAIRKDGDSVGAVVEVVVRNLQAGLGEPVFDKLDARLAYGLMSLPAVKGVEIGGGFGLATMRGSEAADELFLENGKITVVPNYSGGTNGGMSNGSDLIVRVALKPTSSIRHEKRTVCIDWDRYEETGDLKWSETSLAMGGRHDPCVGLRAVPNVEAMVALVLCDLWLLQRQIEGWKPMMADLWENRPDEG